MRVWAILCYIAVVCDGWESLGSAVAGLVQCMVVNWVELFIIKIDNILIRRCIITTIVMVN